MSFIDSARELLDRTETSLNSLIADALKTKAYGEVATIASMAEAVAAIGVGRSKDSRRTVSPEAGVGVATAPPPAPEPVKSEPSWMRPKA